MSVEAARRALNWPGEAQSERHVLLVLGVVTDHHTDWANITLDELAAQTGFGRGSVIRILRRLVDAGAVTRRGSGGRIPSRYRVNERATDTLEVSVNRHPTDTLEVSVNGSQPTPNRHRTDTEPTPAPYEKPARRDRDRDRDKTPPRARTREVVRAELLPTLAPDGAGELAKGLELDGIIAEVEQRRGRNLTRSEAIDARKLAREHRAAGTDRDTLIAALAATKAFTSRALTWALHDQRGQPGRSEPKGYAGLREYARERGLA